MKILGISAFYHDSAAAIIVDGEIVAVDTNGRPSFQALQHRSTRGLSLAYVAFDVLAVGNESFLRRPLEERRAQLRSLLAPPPAGLMRAYPVSTAVSNVRNNGPELLKELEGPEEGTLF